MVRPALIPLRYLPLAPLLLAQGKWVRRVTPKLPEAAGPRSGVVGEGAPLRLLIAGDSSAAGVGVGHQDEALAGRLSAALAQAGRAVSWQLVARTGVDARGLLALLDETPPAPFDVAVMVVGVNDVTGARSPAAWPQDLERLRGALSSHSPGAQLMVSGLPPMHRFPALPQPLRGFLGVRARQFDSALARWASGAGNVRYLGIPELDGPGLVASDGFHPGAGAYAVWAGMLALEIAGLG